MLRININGRWSAKDFADYYESVHELYSLFALISIEEDSARDFELGLRDMDKFYRSFPEGYPSISLSRRYRYLLEASRGITLASNQLIDSSKFREAATLLHFEEQLVVRRCHYASPGATDFTGIGQALGHLKDIVLKCIDVYINRDERRIKNQIYENERDAGALKNVRDRLVILKELGYSDGQCRQILAEISPAVAKLEALAQRGLFTDASTIDNEG